MQDSINKNLSEIQTAVNSQIEYNDIDTLKAQVLDLTNSVNNISLDMIAIKAYLEDAPILKFLLELYQNRKSK